MMPYLDTWYASVRQNKIFGSMSKKKNFTASKTANILKMSRKVALVDREKMAVLPFKALKQQHVLFRMDGRWYRRSLKFNDYGVEVNVIFDKNGVEYTNKEDIVLCSKKIEKNPLVAVFDELLHKKERRKVVAEINLNE